MPTPLRRRLRLARRGAVYGIAIVLVCMAVVLGVASQVLPLVERHPDKVAAWLSERAGRPIAFDAVETQWTRRGPLLQLDGLRIGQGEGVRIGQAEVLVSMYGGLLPGHSFTELRLRGLSLTLQRADDGVWSVRGLPGQQTGGDPLASLEGLGELQIIDGRVALDAPSLGLQLQVPDVDLRLRVDGDRVRAGARARMRGDAAPLQLSVDFDRRRGDGHAYAEVEAEDFSAWSPLLRYAGVVLQGGSGRLQSWASLHHHRVVMMTTEAHLRGLSLQGAALAHGRGVPQVAFGQVDGRVRWRLVRDGWRFDAPQLRVGHGTQQQVLDGLMIAGGRRYGVLARQIDAAPLFAVLGLSDRLEPGLRNWLAQARPHARLAELEIVGDLNGPMRGQGRVLEVGFASVGHAPGLSGLAGRFLGDGEGFRLQLDSASKLRFDWPSGFGVVHDVTLDGQLVGWRDGKGWRVGTSALRVRGKDYGAHVRGGMWFQNDGTRPWIDLAADLDEAPVPAAKGFWIHQSMPKAAVDWLNAALVSGEVRNGRAIVSGDLDDWPFENHNGRFEAVADIVDGQIKFQPEWPAMDNVDAHVAFIANGFALAGRGALAGVPIEHFSAGIADFGDSNLRVDARSQADAGKLLAMLKQSPLHKSYAETLDNLQAAGHTRARFHLLQPLKHDSPTKRELDGDIELAAATLADKRWNLAFSEVAGKVSYNGDGFVADGLKVVHQMQPGTLSLRAGGGTRDRAQAFEAELTARLDAKELLDRAPEMAWLKPYIDGRSDWNVGVTIPRGATNTTPTQLQLRSQLVGTTLTLPAPLDKPAFAALPTTVKTALPMGAGQIDVAFGQRLALRARASGDQTGVRVVLGSDTVNEAPPASGLIATGRARSLDAMDWIALARGGSGDSKLPLRHVDVSADRLLLLGGVFPATRVQLAPAANALAITLEGQNLAGGLLVPDARGAAIAGRLSRLHWRSATSGATTSASRANSAAPPMATTSPGRNGAAAEARADADAINPADVPPLQLDVDDLRFGEANLGSARLRTRNLPTGMQIEQLQLRSPEQSIDVVGTWLGQGARARTQLELRVNSQDFGKLLDNVGYVGRMRGGHGQLQASAGWAGSPAAFSLSALEGQVSVDAKDGHLLEVEPGAGRVIGLLSVAELRRRLMLDFSDFFSKGFAFNQMEGSMRLGNGMAHTDSLVIDGPAAEIRIRGDTDLRAQQFDQTVDVLPKSANVLTAVGAVAGGPIGAAVGAVANAVLKKPLSEMGAKTYRVTGPWKDPKVEVLSREQSRLADPGGHRQAGLP
ncbi:MAG TPA: YhdP family protein [Pseudoxanthomonas sp.]|nr:YhdP family protein [Pseudoxanthomonas sp.]